MKAKIITQGTPVLIRQKQITQGSVVDSAVFMYKKRLCVRLVGFKSIIPVSLLEVI